MYVKLAQSLARTQISGEYSQPAQSFFFFEEIKRI